ncbi:MAG: protoporphyrinogen oxidase, partial [Candidatus Limnocylindria bacterium]
MSVLVIGGGITGLVATRELRRSGVAVTLLEAGPRLGGKVGTERVDGFLVERGPDSFLTQKPCAVELCGELGLGDALVAPRPPSTVYLWHRGKLVPVPEGTGFGIPRAFRPFARSSLFSPAEKLRAGLELVVPRHRADGDVAVGAFLRHRFGDALVDRLASPIIGSVYGTSIDDLSLLAVLPRLREAERRYGSLLRAAVATRADRPGTTPGPPILTLREGMGGLVDRLAAELGDVEVRTEAAVRHVARSGSGYVATLETGARVEADGVVVATPAPAAARILGLFAPRAATALRAMPYGSTVAVSLGYAESQLGRPLAGHGFLVPQGALRLAACTWTSSKWPGRAPTGAVLVRAAVRDPRLLAAQDDRLIAAVHAELALALGIRGRPVMANVSRHLGV